MVFSGIDIEECTFCGICQQHCVLLEAHDICLGDAEKFAELAYSCLMCGECARACPVEIDGAWMAQLYREEEARNNNGAPSVRSFDAILAEKIPYVHRDYSRATSGSVLFAGCASYELFPQTMDALASLLRLKAGMGVIRDCCGKPLNVLGMTDRFEEELAGLKKRLGQAGVTEVVCVCPSCYYLLREHLDIPVLDIFQKLDELDVGNRDLAPGFLFPSCPDRDSLEIALDMQAYVSVNLRVLKEIPCCGAGGLAFAHDPEIAQRMTQGAVERAGCFALLGGDDVPLYTYCASCAGQLTKAGCTNVHYILSDILRVKEHPNSSGWE